MTDPVEAAILREVLVDPLDDGPRLVYADWCEDHDKPDLAAFVRWQMGRGELPDDWRRPCHEQLYDAGRAMRLELVVAERSVSATAPNPKWSDGAYVVERGWPSTVRFAYCNYATDTELRRAFSRRPIERVEFTGMRPLTGTDAMGRWFAWVLGTWSDVNGVGGTDNSLDMKLYGLLKGGRDMAQGHRMVKRYASAAEAVAALRTAATAYGRSLVS